MSLTGLTFRWNSAGTRLFLNNPDREYVGLVFADGCEGWWRFFTRAGRPFTSKEFGSYEQAAEALVDYLTGLPV